MKNLISFLFLSVLAASVAGQSIQSRYASRITPDGTIYFINPQKLGLLTDIKMFEYDMTLLSWTDSVTINFTIATSIMNVPENLKILSGNSIYECNDFSVLFIDIKKSHYEIRVTSKFPTSEISQIIASANPPSFSFTQDGVSRKASYKNRVWGKDQKRLTDIFKLYQYSKK